MNYTGNKPLRIADYGLRNERSAIHDPQSTIRNPQSAIRGAVRLFPAAVITMIVLVLLIGYMLLWKGRSNAEIVVYDLIKDHYKAEDLLNAEVLADVDFGNDSSASYLLNGFSSQYEDWGGTTIAWSDSKSSTIRVPLDDVSSDKRGFLMCQPYNYEGMPQQTIEISLNDKYLTTLDMGYDLQEYQFLIPASHLRSGDNIFTFTYGNVAVPAEVAGTDDVRTLAVAFDYFTIKNPEVQKEVSIASWTINKAAREVIAQNPNELINYYFEIPQEAKLKFDLGVRPEAWGRFKAAKFEVVVETETAPPQTVFSKAINAGKGQLEWMPGEVNLDALAGKLVRMRFSVYSEGDENLDSPWMGWGRPRITSEQDKYRAAEVKEKEREEKSTKQKFNIILILADGLRFDHLGYSGYPRRTSPNIDAVALESSFFTQAVSQSNAALPSHATIFTSMHPYAHKIMEIDDMVEKPHIPSWLDIMKAKGYEYSAVAFVDDPQIESYYGALGFETFMPAEDAADAADEKVKAGGSGKIDPSVEKLNSTITAVGDWLEAHGTENFFLVLQTSFLYPPFAPPAPYDRLFYPEYYTDSTAKLGHRLSEEKLKDIHEKKLELDEVDTNQIIALYDGEIKYLDLKIGDLFNQMNSMGLGKNTILALTSAHGIPLAEHGEHSNIANPGYSLYDEEIHVPLILRFPDTVAFEKKSIPFQVRLLDIMPTIMDVMGLHPIEKIHGVSLRPLIKGKPLDLTAISQSSQSDLVSIRTNEWKLICRDSGGSLEELKLSNVKIDSGEANDFKDRKPILAKYLRQELRGRINFPDKH